MQGFTDLSARINPAEPFFQQLTWKTIISLQCEHPEILTDQVWLYNRYFCYYYITAKPELCQIRYTMDRSIS
jgi:hypothetical protein